MNNPYLERLKLNLDFYFAELLNKPLVKPHWVYLDLSHDCNYNCIMCGVNKILRGYSLSFERIKKIVNEIKSWGNSSKHSRIMLTGGEIFLRKDIFNIIDYIPSLGIPTDIVSNGSLITKKVAKKLINSKLENIAISLDGAKSETHDKIRGVKGAFEKTTKAIKLLTSIKKEIGKGPKICVWTTIMELNIKELYDVLILAKSLGIECLIYHPIILNPADMQHTPQEGILWPSKESLKILKENLDKIVIYKKKYGLVEFLHNPYLFLDYFKNNLTQRDWKCNPFEFISIGPDGSVQSCGNSFGNLKNSNLDTILCSNNAKRIRQKMKTCNKNCLQTCWARPEADNLSLIAHNFLKKLEPLPKEEQKSLLREALQKIGDYQRMLKWEASKN